MTGINENIITLKGCKEFIRGHVPSDPIEFTTRVDGSVPDGIPKSGRVWKTKQNQRYSDMLRTPQLKSSWNKKMQAKRDAKASKDHEKELRAAKSARSQLRRERADENRRNREENARKSEIVQTIKNTAKIKKMKRKQLRMIEKR